MYRPNVCVIIIVFQLSVIYLQNLSLMFFLNFSISFFIAGNGCNSFVQHFSHLTEHSKHFRLQATLNHIFLYCFILNNICITSMANSESPVNLTCMVLDYERKLEQQEETHTGIRETMQIPQRKAWSWDSNQETSCCKKNMQARLIYAGHNNLMVETRNRICQIKITAYIQYELYSRPPTKNKKVTCQHC